MTDSPRTKTSRTIYVLIAVLLFVSYELVTHRGAAVGPSGPGGNAPQSSAGQMASSPPGPSADFGPLKIECTAAIDPSDLSGERDYNAAPLNLHDGSRPISSPANFDNHKYTGTPTVRTVVRAKAVTGATDWWAYQVQNVTAGTRTSSAKPGQGISWTSMDGDPNTWYGVDGEIAGGYPDSGPKVVGVAGVAYHFGNAAESISLSGWSLASDMKDGACLVWNASSQIITPSGVVVVPMNPSDLATTAGPIDTSVAAYRPAAGARYITVYLAIKMPDSEFQSSARMPPGFGGFSLGAQAPFHGESSSQQTAWDNVWTPGAAKIQRVPGQIGLPPSPQLPLIRSDFEVYKLQVMYVQPSLPANISLKLERTKLLGLYPFTLAAPVRDKFPAGWNRADFDATEYRPTR